MQNRVRQLFLPPGPDGAKQGLDDFFAAGGTLQQLDAMLARELPAKADDTPGKGEKARLLGLVDDQGFETWHTPLGDAFMAIRLPAGGLQSFNLASKDAEMKLRHLWYDNTGGAPAKQAVSDVLDTLRARAQFKGSLYEARVRVGGTLEAIYMDDGTDAWSAIEISPMGWRTVPSAPVHFWRPPGFRPTLQPVRGGRLDDLRPFINVATDDDFRLLLTVMASWLLPNGPYVVLVIDGEQGTAKSTGARIVRLFIDPVAAPLRSAPRNDRDMAIAASNGWLFCLDNLSSLAPWLSDNLCRLSTGGAIGTRQLYTNADEALFELQRPVLLTGITQVVTRGDLRDRDVEVTFVPIPDDSRRTEKEIWEELATAAPGIFGALLDALVGALRDLPTVVLPNSPRMADFGQFGVALTPHIGWTPERFLAALARNRDAAMATAMESELAQTVVALVDEHGAWSGTSTALLRALVALAPKASLPATATGLGKALTRLSPALRNAGVDFWRDREANRGRNRHVHLAPYANDMHAADNICRDLSKLSEVSETPVTGVDKPTDHHADEPSDEEAHLSEAATALDGSDSSDSPRDEIGARWEMTFQ